jgi:hypothetical protein
MNRDKRIGLLGGLVAVAAAIGPWAIAAWLLWRAWRRQAGVRLSALDGSARLLAAATATLPADRRGMLLDGEGGIGVGANRGELWTWLSGSAEPWGARDLWEALSSGSWW